MQLPGVISVPITHNRQTAYSASRPVSVKILSVLDGGIVRIAINGFITEAKTAVPVMEGTVLPMQMSVKDRCLILTPLPEVMQTIQPDASFLNRLGLPSSELAAALVRYFQQAELPLYTQTLSRMLTILKKYYPHEKEAAFAAALLYARDIEPDVPLIEHALYALFNIRCEGYIPAKEDEADDFCTFINHVKAKKNHWIIIPLEKQFIHTWKGTAGFLLNIEQAACLEWYINLENTAADEQWKFVWKDAVCMLSCVKNGKSLSESEVKQYRHLFEQCLLDAGLIHFTTVYQMYEEKQICSLEAIDISV